MNVLSATAAAWIRDVVLPPKYRANAGDLTVCPCQWSASGHCQGGQHGKCPRTWGWERHGEPQPETYIAGRDWTARTPVWRVGRACRWLCPCDCHEQTQALFPPPVRRPGRLSTTGSNGHGRIASTDQLRAFDKRQSSLFDLTGGAA